MVSPTDIKKLRDQTGAGFMDCKKALEESNSDIDLAVEWLRKKGVSSAEKKSSRQANEGLIAIDSNDNEASIIEINSETDFVARNSDFQEFVSEISKINFKNKGNLEKILNENYKTSKIAVSEALSNLISKIGEKITLSRTDYLNSKDGFVGSYLHNIEKDNMGKIGVIISTKTNANSQNDLNDFLKKISMHIAATNPLSLNIEDLNDDHIKKEREIQLEKFKSENSDKKDENMINKIIDGKMKKYYNEVVLMEQNFVIDDKMKISEYIEQVKKDLNVDIHLEKFIRYKIGEKV